MASLYWYELIQNGGWQIAQTTTELVISEQDKILIADILRTGLIHGALWVIFQTTKPQR